MTVTRPKSFRAADGDDDTVTQPPRGDDGNAVTACTRDSRALTACKSNDGHACTQPARDEGHAHTACVSNDDDASEALTRSFSSHAATMTRTQPACYVCST